MLGCLCQVNGESVLRFEYDVSDHSETVYDHQHNELLLLHYDAAGRVVRVVPRTHLDPLNVTYDGQGRWTHWSRGDLTVTRVFDEPTGRLIERRLGGRTGYRYVYKNTSKASYTRVTCSTHGVHNCSGIFRISVRRGQGAIGVEGVRRGGGAGPFLRKKVIFCSQNDNFGCILTQFLTGRSLGGHGFYNSVAKRSLQKQCQNYPKIHGHTKGVRSHNRRLYAPLHNCQALFN